MGINPLKILGTVGKGLATVVGLTVGGGSAAALVAVPPVDLNVTLELILQILVALGALLASFGIGRKGGYEAVSSGQGQ